MANTKSIDLEASSSQSLTRADTAVLDITGDMTFECWIKFESNSNGVVASKWGDSISWARGAWKFRASPSAEEMSLSLAGSGASEPSVSTVSVTWTPSLATWYHIAVVYDASAGSAKFYVNGTQQGTTQTGLDNQMNNNALPFGIGCNYDGSDQPSNFFDGLIDDARLWKEARTQTEIADNYKKELTGTETNLVGYWKFNDSLADATTNSLTLTNNYSATYSSDIPDWAAKGKTFSQII